ncbi:putative DNA oxidative demethylase [Rosa chinensis]|uniref:DNA N(6)-methyladenine demethylase n=2 Tax=Rosa chinensis TaxID=74649 RepID=A0A2P6RYX7_ROSCH|nr:putative DNA oxidative demethylase [Rosa chinensis]
MQIGENFRKMTRGSDNHMQSKSEAKDKPFPIKSPISSFGHQKPELSEHKAVDSSFDLCPTKASGAVTLKTSLLVQNRERKNEIKRSMEQPIEIVLQSGMVLLKSYISTSDQIKIVKLCRDLGLGPGGFYKPGYRDGAKLNLMMMCLGKNWDPETSKYGDHRPHDGAKPPFIPVDFFRLVENAIKDSHSLIRKDSKASNSEYILPRMTPDICLVNFYSSTGRLGLHQDRDESEQSLRKQLPVVSFSIGDAAEFLYGDQRDVELAKKITLESGDVLIFGGESRHIFHGVASIQPNTAPKTLLEETKLQPGRLNLTFRKY